ncbi:MAG: carboxypeptidase-like regulatory domain-containing protein, partial [Bacteroidota bacterium]
MRTLLLSVFILCLGSSFSQNTITGVVQDSQTGEPLPYCSISVKSRAYGSITNAEGFFSISANLNRD